MCFYTTEMPNTDSTRKFVKRFFDADAPLPKDNLHIPEKVSSNRSHSQHDKYMCEMKENYTKFMLHWEYIKKKLWFDLHSKRACMHRQSKSQQKFCIYIHIRQLLFTKSTKQIVKRSDLHAAVHEGEQAPLSFCFATKLGFFPADKLTLKITCFPR